MTTRKKSFNLIEEYKQSWKYLKESKKFIYLSVGIFFLFVFIGFFVPVPELLKEKMIELIKEITEQTKGLSHLDLIGFIIVNNIKSTFFWVLLGTLFGIFPILGAVVNGYFLGFVSLLSVNNGGILTLWKILPHGIFELPAIFISLGIGLKLGTVAFQKKRLNSFKYYLTNSLKIFLLIIVPLLVVAGIIEGTFIVLVN